MHAFSCKLGITAINLLTVQC